MSWRERLIQEPALADMSRWPVVDESTLTASKRRGLLRNKRIVARILATGSCTQAAESFGCSPGLVSQLMNRCLGGDLNEPAPLTYALIPHVRLAKTQRRRDLPHLESDSGATGAFSALLALQPGLKAELEAAILADHRRTRNSQRLTPARLHHLFLRHLHEVNWPLDRYPFTSSSKAAESVRRYLKRRQSELQMPNPRRERFTGMALTLSTHRALSTVQIDEHLMHLHTNISIQFNDERIALRLKRCSLLLAIDVASQCILGFELRPTTAPNQDDVLALFDRCLTPRAVPEIHTPGFDDLVLPAIPAQMSTRWPMTFGTIQFDNAWIHHSNSVEQFLCNTMGATASFGLAGQPKTRWLVEHVFDYLEEKLGHRFDSTTATHPRDARKESSKNAKQVPLLPFQSLLDALYLQIAKYNHSSMPNLAGKSPMEVLERHLREHWIRWPRGGIETHWQPFRSTRVLPVHRSRQEARRPYVQFCYCRYTGEGLLSLLPEDTRIVVEYNRRDIRTLTARTLQGRDLGPLECPRTWRRFAHSYAKRSWLFKQNRVARYDQSDPITGYFRDLLNHKRTPDIAAEILSLYLDVTPEGGTKLFTGKDAILATVTNEIQNSTGKPSTRPKYEWAAVPFSTQGRR